MRKCILALGCALGIASGALFAQPDGRGDAGPLPRAFEPLQHWEFDYESGWLRHVGTRSTSLDYVLLPQILTLRTPAVAQLPLAGGELVLRSRFSLLVEPVVEGPEHHYTGLSASGVLEWWNPARNRVLFFSSGGGFGEMDSKGHEIVGAQGEDFNFNWFAYGGMRFRCADRLNASLGLYFQHISNGGMNKVNPGLDALGPMLSLGWHF